MCTYFIKHTRLSSGVNCFISAKLSLPMEDICMVTLLPTSLEEGIGTESPINGTSLFSLSWSLTLVKPQDLNYSMLPLLTSE